MSYNYQTERPWLFTEKGSMAFIKARDEVKQHLAKSGAVRFDKLKFDGASSSWSMLAIMDRMVELKELEVWNRPSWSQFQIYTDPNVDRY